MAFFGHFSCQLSFFGMKNFSGHDSASFLLSFSLYNPKIMLEGREVQNCELKKF